MLLLLECLPILSIKRGFLRTICKKKRSYPRSGLHYRNGSRVKIDRDREIRIEISGIDLSRSKITVQKSLRGEQRSDNRTWGEENGGLNRGWYTIANQWEEKSREAGSNSSAKGKRVRLYWRNTGVFSSRYRQRLFKLDSKYSSKYFYLISFPEYAAWNSRSKQSSFFQSASSRLSWINREKREEKRQENYTSEMCTRASSHSRNSLQFRLIPRELRTDGNRRLFDGHERLIQTDSRRVCAYISLSVMQTEITER